MKKKSLIRSFLKFCLCLFIFIFTLGAILLVFNPASSDEDAQPADGFEISAYNVVLDVNENNVVEVTENITVNFTSAYKHGIYKFTPEWLPYTNKEGKTVKRKSLISDYRAVGDAYVVDTVNKKQRLKIGNAHFYVGLGEKTYVIKYTYNMGKDPFKNFDEFIFHAFGDYWGTEIKNASIEVNMPKDLNGVKVNFFLDKYRENSANEFVNYSLIGNKITAKFNQDKYLEAQRKEYCEDIISENLENCTVPSYILKTLNRSLTIDVELPEGYFVGGSWNYGFWSFIICLAIFIVTIYAFITWIRYGKDFPKRSKTVEFYAPDNYSAAEIGYIYGKQNSKKLTIALIIQLASKGYIKIDEIKEKKKKEIQITNLMMKPVEDLSYDDLVPKRVMVVRQLRPADSNVLDKNEMRMMKYMFKKGEEKELKATIDKFLQVKDSLVEKGFVQIVSDNEDTRYDEYNRRKEEYEKSRVEYEKQMKKYDKLLAQKEPLTDLEYIVYNRLFESKEIVILSEHKTFYKAFSDVGLHLDKKLKDVLNDKKAHSKWFSSILITVAVFFFSLISFLSIEDLDPKFSWLYALSFTCVAINIYLTMIMRRKTKYGEEITAKVEGFKHFLETVEKDKLEALVSENPNYFYNILPYTYVLNISKKWIKKFEDIPVPDVDMGTYDFNSFNSFNNIYDDVYYPPSTGSGSGCSSCGGGCSSCGGGCSSCGGGGSW